VANVLGAAVARARAQARVITVRDAERRRIARDLHDYTLQSLSDARALAADLERAPREAVAARSAKLATTLASVARQLQTAIYELRLGGNEALPFRQLLEGLVAVQQTRADDAVVELSLGDGVPREAFGARGTDVLRILAEALANARRHAIARHVVVRVWTSGANLFAEVTDDGRGFDATAGPSDGTGTGIRGMRERAHLLHGRLEIRSITSGGTTVQLRAPLHIPLTGLAEAARVLLVVEHAAMREAIAAAFGREAGFVVVGQAASLVEARHLLADVDVAVLDIALSDGYGPDLIADLRRASPGAQALVLSATVERGEVARAVERGAAGVLHKARPLDEVVGAVRTLQAGESLMPIEEVVNLLRFAARTREREHADRQAIGQLTRREREVLQALADGLDSRGAATRLHISLRTQRNHVANILAKLGVHSQLQALVLVLRYGIVTVREPGDTVQDEHDSP
jgi:DNA-binding NarL/FixJ family response regulator/two-component sensor histidine kinase